MPTELALVPTEAAGWPSQLGPYQVVDCIAEGGMGRVFRAYDPATGQALAIKTPRSAAVLEIAALMREVSALRAIRHSGVVRLISEGTSGDLPWMAMELVDGETLYERIDAIWRHAPSRRARASERRRRSEELPTRPVALRAQRQSPANDAADARPPAAAGRLQEVLSIVANLALTLDHVHESGLVHRDVKPANVMLSRGGTRSKLLDFGLACWSAAARPARQMDRVCVGTMQYAAPEQIAGEKLDARTDIYALGCILYEMVTGIRPFDGDSSNEVAQKHLYREAWHPADLVSDLPWQLEDLLLEMLAKNPDQRPPTARAVAHRLTLLSRRLASAPQMCTTSPSAAAVASYTASERVGWGWTAANTSWAVASEVMASDISAIRSVTP
jgi:eukaryotic-like serine/threonine-protein kinase